MSLSLSDKKVVRKNNKGPAKNIKELVKRLAYELRVPVSRIDYSEYEDGYVIYYVEPYIEKRVPKFFGPTTHFLKSTTEYIGTWSSLKGWSDLDKDYKDVANYR